MSLRESWDVTATPPLNQGNRFAYVLYLGLCLFIHGDTVVSQTFCQLPGFPYRTLAYKSKYPADSGLYLPDVSLSLSPKSP